MLRKRFIALLITLFALFLLGYLFRGPIISATFQWYFKGYCLSCLGGNLNYSHVEYENGKWVFANPTLETKENLKAGGYHFRAEKAAIDVNVSWAERTVEFIIALSSPHLEVGNEAKALKQIVAGPSENYRFFHVHSRYDIPQGSAIIHIANGDNIPVYYTLNLSCKENHEGCAGIWLNDRHHTQPHLSMKLAPETTENKVFLDFNGFDAAVLLDILQEFFPKCINAQLSNGIVDGNMILALPKNNGAYAEGHLALKHIDLSCPTLQSNFNIPHATVDLIPQSLHNTQDSSPAWQTAGTINIAENSSIVFTKDKLPYWTLQAIQGTLAFNSAENAVFSLIANCNSDGDLRRLQIGGATRFADPGQTSLTLDLHLQGSENQNDVNVTFTARELGEEWRFAEIELSGISKDEFEFLKYLTSNFYEIPEGVDVYKGSADLSMLVYQHGLNIAEIQIENIAVHNLEVAAEPWDIYSKVEEASGSLSFDLSALEPIQTLNTNLNITNGLLNLGHQKQNSLHFDNIHTNLKVKEGIIQKSLLQGSFAGLKGAIELDGTTPGPLAFFDFGGQISQLAHSLPETFWTPIDKNFSHDTIKIIGNAAPSDIGMVFKGSLLINDQLVTDEIPFGFTIDRFVQTLWQHWPPQSLAIDYGQIPIAEMVNSLLPVLTVPSTMVYDYIVQQSSSIGGFAINNGWFSANNLRLGKYLAPFMFDRNQLRMSGYGDFKGTFDQSGCIIRFDARELLIDNNDLAMEIKCLSEGLSPEERHCGVYTIDFLGGPSKGSFPIRNGTYFEKNSGLLFTDISALATIEQGLANFTNLETYCNGVFFGGKIDLDWRMPGDGFFDVDIQASKMHGRISQIQNIFTHFAKSLFLVDIPLEGNIDLHGSGGFLHFGFNPDGYTFQTHTEGAISDGKLKGSSGEFVLQEIAMNFVYDHADNILDFSDFQGTLLVGSSKHMEEYTVSSDKLRFTDYQNNEIDFDVWVGDKKRDIVRLVGNTKALSDETGQPYINFNFDKNNCHFGDVYPSIFQLTLKDWTKVENFKLEFDFNFKTILQDLQSFSRTGLLFLSKSILKELNALKKADGIFHASFGYDAKQSVFDFHLGGSNVLAGTHQFKEVLFIGKKKGSTWTVDQLQFDDISLALDFQKDRDIWHINFLGARIGNSLLLGLEGKYDEERSVVDAKINLFEANLDHLNELTLIDSIQGLDLGGQLHATGTVYAEVNRALPGGINLQLNGLGSWHSGKIKGLVLDDIKDIALQYTSSTGITIKDLKTSLKSAKDNNLRANLVLKTANCHFKNHQLNIKDLKFSVPASNLPWVIDNLQQSFPTVLTPPIADVIRDCKKEGELSGKLNISLSDAQCTLGLDLEDSQYHLLGTPYFLKKFSLNSDPLLFKITSQYDYQSKHLGLEFHTTSPTFDSGEFVVFELEKSAEQPHTTPLTFHWQIDPFNGYIIEKIDGSLCGLTCNLIRDPKRALAADNLYLQGAVHFNMNYAKDLLDPTLASKIASWELGRGYALNGHWSIKKGENKPITERLSFQGELQGKNFELWGYQFANLTAQLNYYPNSTILRRLLLSDQGASMQIDEVVCLKQENDNWKTAIPRILIRELCPSTLHVINPTTPKDKKTLVINTLEINGLNGFLGDRNSFKGNGHLTFSNPPKKNLQHTIFAIPADILTRIGLDPEVLTPVKGLIEYDIRDAKVVLTRFKDVYSKKKVSKFYLPNNNFQSYVDFDGNVNMQVRMKQYNLIFKLAELFTVTIQGTLQKPVYNLQRQTTTSKNKKISLFH